MSATHTTEAPITDAHIASGLQGQRVLLVGGAGFIGHHVALSLRSKGAEVMVVDHLGVNHAVTNEFDDTRHPIARRMYRNSLLSRLELLREAGVRLENVDACYERPLSDRFDQFQPTKVVHLAAISSAVQAKKTPGVCFDLQLISLRNTLELARRSSTTSQVMLMSSSTVYGDFEGSEVNEDSPLRPRGIYANAKFMGEKLLQTYGDQYGLGTTIIRPSALYGERCVSRRVSQLFIENALLGKALRLDGGGEGRLDFTYVADLADGITRALALHRGPEDHGIFNLTYGAAQPIKTLAEVVKDLVPEVQIEVHPWDNSRPVRGTLSIDRARAQLGFVPQWPLSQGYRRYCEWYIEGWRQAQKG
ncbi:MAG: NAD-dependent epimerase/dehydratase family protein [Bradymonadia bacterium]